MHVPTAFGPPPQTVPHVPQFVALTCVLISQPFAVLPSQFAKFAMHWIEHTLLEHRGVAFVAPGHDMPQPPQFAMSEDVACSQPSVAFPLQLLKPGLQLSEHVALVHVGAAFGAAGQAFVQVPQCAAVLFSATSHPFVALPSQSAKPTAHVSEHTPALHAAVELGPK